MASLSSFQVGGGTRGTVLLHGFLGGGRNLRTLATRWSERDPSRRFLLPDLTGHGASPALPPGATLETLAGDVAETAVASGLTGPVDWVGHSLGGRVALVGSRLRPELFGSLTLLDISPGPIPREVSESGQVLQALLRAPATAASRTEMRHTLLEEGLTVALADWLVMNLEPDGASVRWRIDRAALDGLQRRVNGIDLWPLFADESLPRLCVRGGRSPYVSDHDLARMEALGARTATVQAGHYVHVEALDALLDVTVEWFSERG